MALLREPERVGVCIDSCHVFAAGYDIRTLCGYEEMVRAVQATVGLERVRCWHLNDSKGTCGSRLDRHEHIGRGALGVDAFAQIVRDPRWTGLPMILETAKEKDENGDEWDSVNLRTLRGLL